MSKKTPAKKTDGAAEEMLKLSTAGASFPDISKRMKGLGCSQTEIDQGFNALLNYYKTLAEFNPEIERGRSYARLNLLFLSSLKIQDYKTSLAVQKEINKLLALYDGAKTPEDLTLKAIDAIIDG